MKPPPEKPHDPGWIDSKSIQPSSEPLAPDEVRPFLDWVFLDLAKRPAALRLGETARAVRFLRSLAAIGVPKDVAGGGQDEINAYFRRLPDSERERRDRLDELGLRLWSILLQVGEVETGSPAEARRLLKRLRGSYLAGSAQEVAEALELIDELAIPPGEEAFPPPRLRSKTLSYQGEPRARQPDDLSERVYAAYYALGEANQRRRAHQVAKALKRLKIKPKRRKHADWIAQDVSDLAKSHERSLLEREPKEGRGRKEFRQQAAAWRTTLFRAERAHADEERRKQVRPQSAPE